MVAVSLPPPGVGFDRVLFGSWGPGGLVEGADVGGVDTGVALPPSPNLAGDGSGGRFDQAVGEVVDALAASRLFGRVPLLLDCLERVLGEPVASTPVHLGGNRERVDDIEDGVQTPPQPVVGVLERSCVIGEAKEVG